MRIIKQQKHWIKWLKRLGYAGLVLFSVGFALAGIADDIASTIRALPAIIDSSRLFLQITSLSIGIICTIGNVLMLTISLPRSYQALKRLQPLNLLWRYCAWRFGLYRLNYWWQRWRQDNRPGRKLTLAEFKARAKKQFPNRRGKAILIAFIFSLFTGAAFAFFTASSANTTILGLSALFGLTISTGGIGVVALIVVLTAIQGFSMFMILAAECGGIANNVFDDNDKIAWVKLRRFFMLGEFAPTDRQQHLMRIFKIGFSLAGGLVIVGAAFFLLMGQAEAVSEVMTNVPQWVTIATQVTVIYIMAGITQISLSMKGAAEIMGGIGKSLGAWIGKKTADAKLRAQIEYRDRQQALLEKAHTKPWAKQSFPERLQTFLNRVPFRAVTLVFVSFSFLGSFFTGMRGDAPLHGKLHHDSTGCTSLDSAGSCSFHQINNALEQNPLLINQVDHIRPAPLEWQGITAGAFTGFSDALTDAFLLHEEDEADDVPEASIKPASKLAEQFKRSAYCRAERHASRARLFNKAVAAHKLFAKDQLPVVAYTA